jgi:hypothetical protein
MYVVSFPNHFSSISIALDRVRPFKTPANASLSFAFFFALQQQRFLA